MLGGYFGLAVPDCLDPFDVATALANNPDFDYVEFDALGESLDIPNDSLYQFQWNMPKVDMPTAWDITTGSSSTILAIIDYGIDHFHEDLADNIWVNPGEDDGDGIPEFFPISQGGDEGDLDGDGDPDDDGNGYIDDLVGWDFYDFNTGGDNDPFPQSIYAHGTAVAGIAGAHTNNGIGVAGVAGGWGGNPGTKLMNMRIHHYDQEGGALSVAESITYAVENGANVINMSLAFTNNWPVLSTACSVAVYNYDCVLVAGAGNNGGDASSDKSIRYPAKYTTTIAVGATIQDDTRWNTNHWQGWGSAIGPELDLMAPGGESTTYTTDNTGAGGYSSGNYYDSFGGTSASAPVVAGVAALIRSLDQFLTWEQVRDILRYSAEKVDGMGGSPFTNEYGYGRVNAFYAVAPPDAPTNLTSYLESNPYCASCHTTEYSINLDWDDNTEPDLSHYIIYRAESPGNCNLCHQTNNNPPEDSLSDPETLNEDVTVEQDCPALSGEIAEFTKSKVEVETGCQSGLESTHKLTFEPIWAWQQSWWTDIRIKNDYTYTYLITAVDNIAEQESDESNFTLIYVPEGGLAKPLVEFPAEVVPKIFFLYQNYPNPFNPETIIRYQLPEEAFVTIELFNLLGQRIKTLVKDLRPSGYYSLKWGGDDDFGRFVTSGIYIYRITAHEFVQVRKLLLLK